MSDSSGKPKWVWSLGLGHLYVWGAAFVAWMPWWQSQSLVQNVLAFLGMALVSVVCTSLLIYCNTLEQRVEALESRQSELGELVSHYRGQSECAIQLLQARSTPPHAEPQ
jgi:hypothetical protein